MLQIESVSQSFRMGFWLKPRQVLHDVSFVVPEKSVFGFVGANGAGKTTLIHLIVGLRDPSAGEIRIRGLSSQLPQARASVGYLPERPYFHEHLTGKQFLHYFGKLSGIRSASARKDRIQKVLSLVGMSHAAELELGKYSKGMLQRIGVAQALIHDPELLILDEPMSGLDPLGRKEMRELIQGLAADGRTVFFSTHVIPDIESICDRVAMIEKGRLITCGSVRTLMEESTQRWEIAFRGGKRIENVDSRAIPEGTLISVSAQESARVSEILQDILASSGEILWVNPVRRSLEEVFYFQRDAQR